MKSVAVVGALAHVLADTPTEAGVELIVTTSDGPTPRTCFEAPNLPSWAHGQYIVSGPAQFEIGKYKYKAIFDGIGMTNSFELLDQKICYTSVWMDTKYRNETEKWKCPAPMGFEDTIPSRPLTCLNMGSMDNNWVNVIDVGGQAMMLTDSTAMITMDFETLEFHGWKTWNDTLLGMGSAHPVQRPGTSTWVGITESYGLKSHVEFFTYDAQVKGNQPRPIGGKSEDLKIPPFMHSYGVTPNYVVMPINLGMSVNPNCTSSGILCGLNGHWQGIHVVDKDGTVQVFDTDPFYHVHIVNAFENATGVTLDVGGYDSSPFAVTGALDIQMYLNKTERDANPVRATMRRVHMHTSGPLKGKATYQLFNKVPGSHTDFFRLNPDHIGMPYCYYYGTQWWHDGANYANMAILKHDLCTDTSTYWTATDHYVGEPFFIPNPDATAEDDGVLIFVALDGPNRRSKLVTVDAKTMQEVDGATIHLEKHIPFTAHGNFFPAKTTKTSMLV